MAKLDYVPGFLSPLGAIEGDFFFFTTVVQASLFFVKSLLFPPILICLDLEVLVVLESHLLQPDLPNSP
jgi:hypothetical protein